MDMYMASVEKQLLGTETVQALRSHGCKSRICGLSANDVEENFINAGADAFMFKVRPYPTYSYMNSLFIDSLFERSSNSSLRFFLNAAIPLPVRVISSGTTTDPFCRNKTIVETLQKGLTRDT
jgi:hypothetical protein